MAFFSCVGIVAILEMAGSVCTLLCQLFDGSAGLCYHRRMSVCSVSKSIRSVLNTYVLMEELVEYLFEPSSKEHYEILSQYTNFMLISNSLNECLTGKKKSTSLCP
jgi:hypothetical protein